MKKLVLMALLVVGCGHPPVLVAVPPDEPGEEVVDVDAGEVEVTLDDDAGVVVVIIPPEIVDAGVVTPPEEDAGVVTPPEEDAGLPEEDAGTDNGPVSNGCLNGRGHKYGLIKHGRCD